MYDEVSVGDRFGRYTVIAEAAPAITLSKRRRWLCRCDCGNERIVEEPNLRHGKSTNCGCVRYQNMAGNKYNFRENAHHKDRLHHIWVSMRSRCNSETNPSYRNYGAKGVSVCAERDDYEAFKKWAYENGYDDKAKYGVCTIDRINPYGNYEPSNCRWASVREQANNKKKTIYIEYDGETLPLSYWAERFSIPYHTLYDRLYRYGWSVKKAFTAPVRRSA